MRHTTIDVIGSACHEWDYRNHRCAESLDVAHVSGTRGVHFISKLATDADGAPLAYHPQDRRPYDNTAHAYDWLANINVDDLFGIQGQGGAVGPAQGYYISATTLSDPRYPNNDTRRWVDASLVPYVVLPGRALPVPNGLRLKLGCLAFVVDTRTGHFTGAIYADVGRAVGEGSVALALRLGLKPFYDNCAPKVSGFSGKRFFYLVFPAAATSPPWYPDKIHEAAFAEFEAWGGEEQLRQILNDLPALKGPATIRPYALPDTKENADTIPDLVRPEGRGSDVSKFELEAE